MKRWISSLMLAGLAASVMAQAPFTIVRPADGSKVREKVRILIPKNSLPPGGYVGVFLDGKLIEATVPPVQGQYRVYTLDTKGRGIPDSEAGKPNKLELVLYTDYNDQARIVDRSSVDVYIGNKANIPVPNRGLTLRYRWVPGQQMVYNLDQRVQISQISEQQQKLGGKAAQVDVESEKIRLLYAVDNAYNDGSGLLRLQALPIKGRTYADLTTADDLVKKRFTQEQMAPIYMRVTNTGHEIFGALPPSVPLFESNAGAADPTHLYAAFPLPTLPTKAVRPGDSWQSRFQEGELDLSKYPNINSVVVKVPARGEFVGVEWESGHPCAKLRNVIEAATISKKEREQVSQLFGGGSPIEDDKISVVETMWFAMDTRKVLKIQRDITIDRKSDAAPTGGFPGMGGGGPMPPSGGGTGGKRGLPGAAGNRGPFDLKQRGGAMGGGDLGLQGPPPNMGGGPPQNMMGGFGQRTGAPAPGGATFTRVRILQIFTLEK